MRNPITSPLTHGIEDLVLPWETAVALFRMHLAARMLRRGMSAVELTEKLNDFKDTTLLEELFTELFSEDPHVPKMAINVGDRSYDATMSLTIACSDGIILKMNRMPQVPAAEPIVRTIDDVEAAIQLAYPDYTVWTDGESRVYVDEGDDDPVLLSPTDAYQKYIVEAGK